MAAEVKVLTLRVQTATTLFHIMEHSFRMSVHTMPNPNLISISWRHWDSITDESKKSRVASRGVACITRTTANVVHTHSAFIHVYMHS